ncbi:MAG: rRNA pseudouridine synthase [Gomphosphaeria aponina SAG 52.96 = DSM 107014]|uniref:Pseudouridine synthase n=1 Tax=Gomphosphaeria aponina SAG 52.96 = DSM 107014 TaxID=1521640 RepID=A0A941GTP6_9CHRO|nr:rRNA pseudouridine synthase [Gomphosphaeria aponina SAG 52.96 = DSM 107014]
MKERVQKILSQWGISSRREAEKMILAGRVKLNGKLVELGQTADPRKDRLQVDGVVIKHRPQTIYLLLNKPAGVVSTCRDPQNRSTVLDLLPSELRTGQGLHPVGRLDGASTGALLLTNDGELTMRLTHPRYHLPKTYEVWVQGHPSATVLKTWREGVMLLGKLTLPAEVQVIHRTTEKTLLKVVMTEGRNRQIRQLAEQLGYEVIKLHRTAIDAIQLQPPKAPMLPSGHYRFLKEFEVLLLKSKVGL